MASFKEADTEVIFGSVMSFMDKHYKAFANLIKKSPKYKNKPNLETVNLEEVWQSHKRKHSESEETFAKKSKADNSDELLSRVTEKDGPGSYIESSLLYDTFKFESIEVGRQVDVGKREFSEYVLHLFNTKKVTKRINPTQTTTVYRGISLKPLETLPKSSCSDLKEIIKLKPTNYEVTSIDSNKLVLSYKTMSMCNGNQIMKHLTFHSNFTWKLAIGDKDIKLDCYGIDDKYCIEAGNLNVIFKAIEKVKLCCGMDINKSVISTRLHTVELLKNVETGSTSRRLRSIMCLKTVKINSRTQVCVMCQKMTIVKKPLQVTTENKITMNKDVLKRLIPCATDGMVQLLLSQFDNAGKHPKGRRWSRDIINVCLQLFSRSPAGYRMLKNSKMLVLPSTQLLVLYKSRIQHKPGFHEDIFRWMHTEATRMGIPKYGWKGAIVLDEMSIQQDLEIKKNGDVVELCGLTDVGEEGNTCNTLRLGKKERALGTHVLQFIFLGITGFRFPFGHFVTNNVAAYDIHIMFWNAISALGMYDFTVLYTSMDGAQSNRTFMSINLGKNPQTMIAQSPENPNNSVVFMMDISHAIKKIRNNIMKSGIAKGCTRNLMLQNGEIIQWQMWADAFHWDQTSALKIHKRLTNEHIYPSSQSKMRNHLADEVLNSDMLQLMCQYKASLINTGDILNGVIKFLEKTAKIIEIFHESKPIHSIQDTRLKEVADISDWFSEWANSVNCQDISSTEKSRKLMSFQCRDDLRSCLIGFCELCHKVLANDKSAYVTPSLINSDVVENHFCQQRSTYNGANSNPTALQYRNNQNSIILGQNIVSKKSNAGKPSLSQVAQSYQFQQKSTPKRKSSSNNGNENKYKKIKVFRM